ncbi:MAG: DUF2497 domain-containing protein [Phyllobacteriaceae bacterium]|nr:DUF2497 domain-containing protein [Phyllobacteriaceae bacterium]
MEDLLASIRKAIDSDVGDGASSTAGETRGTLMRGALREMRVNLNETKAHNRQTAEEIAELRGRILRNATEVPPIPPPPRRLARPMVEPQRQVPPPPRNDFKGIMAGNRAERRLIDQRALPPNLQQEPPPAIRGRTLQDEFDDLTYGNTGEVEHRDYHTTYAEQPMPAEPPLMYDDPQGYYQPAAPQQPRMLSNHAEAATQAAFRHLSESMFAQGMGGRSLEDVTREMLRGMLKQWLDDNLPPLVERLVREEIARVARNGR